MMSETVWAVIITGVVSIVCTILSSRSTSSSVHDQLKLQQAVIETKIDHMKDDMAEMKGDIKEHNNYAKLFSETMPVVQEQIKVINYRIADLEAK